MTDRIGLNHGNQWQWEGKFQENGYLQVEPPSLSLSWTQGASCVEVCPNVYVGNFIAASQASELGVDAVLNLASELSLTSPFNSSFVYNKLGALDGAKHTIPDKILLESVDWIEQKIKQGTKKILVNCRAGIGRIGSVALPIIFTKTRFGVINKNSSTLGIKRQTFILTKISKKVWNDFFLGVSNYWRFGLDWTDILLRHYAGRKSTCTRNPTPEPRHVVGKPQQAN